MPSGCGAPEQGRDLQGVDVTKETVIEGAVHSPSGPAAGAYVRLLDSGGDFTAEVVTSPEGRFRFFARPGPWTLRALAPGATGEASVNAVAGRVTEVPITLA
ncbi:MAG: DUF1416 domain-containing protein [Acidimicrobiales bacterium]